MRTAKLLIQEILKVTIERNAELTKLPNEYRLSEYLHETILEILAICRRYLDDEDVVK